MKFQAYHYENGEVKLDFNFSEDEKMKDNKQKFIGLLENALEELKKEK